MSKRVKPKTPVRAAKQRVKSAPWFLYLLECTGGRLYAGVTPDLDARYAAHCAGRGAKFTRGFPPLRLLAAQRCRDRSTAQRAEAALKKLPRPAKLLWAQRWAYDARPMKPRARKPA